MNFLRLMLLIIGLAAALMGLLWIGQGSGYFPYPRSSFMIDQSPWIVRGALLAVAGIAAMYISRKV